MIFTKNASIIKVMLHETILTTIFNAILFTCLTQHCCRNELHNFEQVSNSYNVFAINCHDCHDTRIDFSRNNVAFNNLYSNYDYSTEQEDLFTGSG